MGITEYLQFLCYVTLYSTLKSSIILLWPTRKRLPTLASKHFSRILSHLYFLPFFFLIFDFLPLNRI